MKDHYKHWGRKSLTTGIDEALIRIRRIYPSAYMEGSAGLARSFFVKTLLTERSLLVGYCWSSGIKNKHGELTWWVRIAPSPQEW